VKQLAERGDGVSSGVPPARPASVPTSSGGGARLAMSLDGGSAAPRLAPDEASASAPALTQPQSFNEVVELFQKHHEAMLRAHLVAHVHLVHFEPGRIEFRPGVGAPRDLPNRLGQLLSQWTGTRWIVSISGEEGAPTLAEQAEAREASLRNEAAQHPLVRKVLETFPGARIEAVREIAAAEAASAAMSIEESGEGDESR
jgi:DNA polymerase III subunit gamma/tau